MKLAQSRWANESPLRINFPVICFCFNDFHRYNYVELEYLDASTHAIFFFLRMDGNAYKAVRLSTQAPVCVFESMVAMTATVSHILVLLLTKYSKTKGFHLAIQTKHIIVRSPANDAFQKCELKSHCYFRALSPSLTLESGNKTCSSSSIVLAWAMCCWHIYLSFASHLFKHRFCV